VSAFWLRLFGFLCLLGAGLYLFYLLYGDSPEGTSRSADDVAPADSAAPSASHRASSRASSRASDPAARFSSGELIRKGLVHVLPVLAARFERARAWLSSAVTSPRIDEARLLELGREASLREGYDAGHAERIADLAVRLGQAIGLEEEVLTSLRWAGWLHDVAPSGLEEVLLAPMALAPRDVLRLQRHPLLCQEAVEALLPGSDVAWWVRMAHERSDGMGYPDAAFNGDLPLPARCLAIADTFEALVHDRPYRRALEPQDALLELQQVAGSQLDAGLVKVFAELVYPTWIR
jgi:HD-GYP domain-containing protein (c-di-GMP phosphodiesterase class II)